jgi:hypothetical protein
MQIVKLLIILVQLHQVPQLVKHLNQHVVDILLQVLLLAHIQLQELDAFGIVVLAYQLQQLVQIVLK